MQPTGSIRAIFRPMHNRRQQRAAIAVHMAHVRFQRQEIPHHLGQTFPTGDLHGRQPLWIGFVIKKPQGHKRPTMILLIRQMQDIADDMYFMSVIGRLWACGVEADWAQIWGEARRNRVVLPTYAFQRSRYFIEPGTAPQVAISSCRTKALAGAATAAVPGSIKYRDRWKA